MSDQDKSEILLMRMGWVEVTLTEEQRKFLYGKLWDKIDTRTCWRDGNGSLHPFGAPDLYWVGNFFDAWLVLNWARDNLAGNVLLAFEGWWDNAELWSLPQADAQRQWVDKIYELTS